MRRANRPILSTIIATLALTACGESGAAPDPQYTHPDDLRIAILLGDGQTAPVVPSAEEIVPLEDTLVGRVITSAGGVASLPPTAVVRFEVSADSCGSSSKSGAVPDEAGFFEVLWVRPASALLQLDWHGDLWGSLCTLDVQLLVDDVLRDSASFSAIFTPGPLARFSVGRPTSVQEQIFPGFEFDMRVGLHTLKDEYGNSIPASEVAEAYEGGSVGWAWHDMAAYNNDPPVDPTGSGWVAVAPDPVASGYQVSGHGDYRLALYAWIDGMRSEGRATFTMPAE